MKSVLRLGCLCALALSCVAATLPLQKSVHRKAPDRTTLVEEATATPTVSGVVPSTRAVSVIVVDARSGGILYEKNADQVRPAASTQKLLTALIVAENGFLDRRVTVQPVDTLAEPVRLNIKPGDSYQRIDLLRALLVKSPTTWPAVSRAITPEAWKPSPK